MIDLQGSIPDFILITTGKKQDPFFLDHLTFQAGAFYVMDRGYLDYGRLYTIHQSKAFFVTRAKKNTRFRRRYSNEVDPTSTVRSDQIGVLDLENSFKRYPDSLRRVSYYDQENDKRLVFLTNHVDVPAVTVAELYRSRWQIELFFKWIKQHLRIKSFYGWSDNAVKSQIWIAEPLYHAISLAVCAIRNYE